MFGCPWFADTHARPRGASNVRVQSVRWSMGVCDANRQSREAGDKRRREPCRVRKQVSRLLQRVSQSGLADSKLGDPCLASLSRAKPGTGWIRNRVLDPISRLGCAHAATRCARHHPLCAGACRLRASVGRHLTGNVTGLPAGVSTEGVEAINARGEIGAVGALKASGAYSLRVPAGVWVLAATAESSGGPLTALGPPVRVRSGRTSHAHPAGAKVQASAAADKRLKRGSVVHGRPDHHRGRAQLPRPTQQPRLHRRRGQRPIP